MIAEFLEGHLAEELVSIDVTRISLSDRGTLNKIPLRPGFGDYKSGESDLLPPPNVKRTLFFSSSLDRLDAVGKELRGQGILDLRIFVAKHSFSYATMAILIKSVRVFFIILFI